MKKLIILLMTLGVSATFSVHAKDLDNIKIAKGRYLVEISGCNDCHTSGYAASGGKVPESKWLLGDQLGYNGPWGTTFPINLRDYISHLSESQWVKTAKTLKARPPMPSWALNAMTKDDLKALYAFIKSLGPVKNAIPAYLPPGKKPVTAYIQWPMPPK